jgi:hypothetical protein
MFSTALLSKREKQTENNRSWFFNNGVYESETLHFYYQIHPSAELYCLINFLFYFQNLALTLFVTCINNLKIKKMYF